MTEYINPKYILVDFLRTKLTDPRARMTSHTETFTATAGQTVFTLSAPSNTVSAVTAIAVDTFSKYKWRDYYPRMRLHQIVFFTAMTGGETVSVTYNYGSEWIYSDKPLTKISANQFPRIGVDILSAPGIRLGQYEAPIESTILFRIQIWAKEKSDDQVFIIGSLKYYGEELTTYLAMQIADAFIDHEDDLHPAMYGYVPSQVVRDMPFDEDYQAHKKELEVQLKTINIGRI
jgi:hypothetical protein